MGRLHVLVRGGSLPLPRPERYDPLTLPYATKREHTFPLLIGKALGAEVSVLCRRGMAIDSFADGLGLGIPDMIRSLEPDIFIACYGYSEVWQIRDITVIREHASEYLRLLMEASQTRPQMKVLILLLPMPGPSLRLRFPDIRARIGAFNEELLAGEFCCVAPSRKLHPDEQHFSNAGHREVASHLLSAIGTGEVVRISTNR